MKIIRYIQVVLVVICGISSPAFSGDFQGGGGGRLESSSLAPHLALVKQVIDEYNQSAQGVSFDTIVDTDGQLFVYTTAGRLYALGADARTGGSGVLPSAHLFDAFEGGVEDRSTVAVEFKIKENADAVGQAITFTLFGAPKTLPAFNEIATQGGMIAIDTLPVEMVAVTITTTTKQSIIEQQ